MFYSFIRCQYMLGNITDVQLDTLTAADRITAEQAAEIKAAKAA